MRHALFALFILFAASFGARPACADDAEEALAAYNRGTKDFRAKRYRDALASFERAFELSKSPNSSLMVGHAQLELDEPVAAARAYRRTIELSVGAKYDRTRAEAQRALDKLDEHVALLTVSCAADAAVALQVGAESFDAVSNGELAEVFAPGPTKVVCRATGFADATESVDLVGGETRRVKLRLTPVESDAPTPALATDDDGPSLMLIGGLAAGGVAVVSWGIAIGFGVSNQGIYDDLESRCGNRCGDAEREDADQGETHGVVANVFFVVAGLATAAAVGLLVTDLVLDDEETRDDAGGPQWHVSPSGIGVRW